MLARLGEVLYWTACGIAALIVVLAVWGIREYGILSRGAFVLALVVWLLGRAVRHLLAAK
jgi:purine-cytosine permease-like protein